MALVSFYTPWKQKTPVFQMFSGDIEKTSGMKWVNLVGGYVTVKCKVFQCHKTATLLFEVFLEYFAQSYLIEL